MGLFFQVTLAITLETYNDTVSPNNMQYTIAVSSSFKMTIVGYPIGSMTSPTSGSWLDLWHQT